MTSLPARCGHTEPSNGSGKMEKLRSAMARSGIDAYIIPHDDAHMVLIKL
jgi:hypothetical protein